MPSKFFIDAAIRVQSATVNQTALTKLRKEVSDRLKLKIEVDDLSWSREDQANFIKTTQKVSREAQKSFDKINFQKLRQRAELLTKATEQPGRALVINLQRSAQQVGRTIDKLKGQIQGIELLGGPGSDVRVAKLNTQVKELQSLLSDINRGVSVGTDPTKVANNAARAAKESALARERELKASAREITNLEQISRLTREIAANRLRAQNLRDDLGIANQGKTAQQISAEAQAVGGLGPRADAQKLEELNRANSKAIAQVTALEKVTKKKAAADKVASAALAGHTSRMSAFGDQSALAVKRYAAYLLPTTGLFAVIAAVRASITAFSDFEREQTRLSQILDISQARLDRFTVAFRNFARETGVAATEVALSARLLAQAGFGRGAQELNNLQKAAEQISKTALGATFGEIEETTTGVIAVIRQFNLELSDTERVLDVVNQVAKDFAIESADVFTAVTKGGSTFSTLNGEFEEFVGLLSLVRDQTRQSAEQLGTFFKTGGLKIFREGADDILREIDASLVFTDNITDRFLGLARAFEKNNFGSIDQARFAEQLVGIRQAERLLGLLNAINRRQDDVEASLSRAGGSVDRDAIKRIDDLAVSFQRLGETLNTVVASILDNDFIKRVASIAANVASIAGGVVSSIAPAIGPIAGAGLVAASPAIGRGVGNFASGFTGRLNQTATKANTIALRANTAALNGNTAAEAGDSVGGAGGSFIGSARSRARTALGSRVTRSGIARFARSPVAIGAGSIGAVLAGSALSPENPLQNRGQARLSGALTGAGIGAGIGSFAGPIGAAAGAVVGSVAGLIKSNKDLQEAIEREEEGIVNAAIRSGSDSLFRDGRLQTRFSDIVNPANNQGVNLERVIRGISSGGRVGGLRSLTNPPREFLPDQFGQNVRNFESSRLNESTANSVIEAFETQFKEAFSNRVRNLISENLLPEDAFNQTVTEFAGSLKNISEDELRGFISALDDFSLATFTGSKSIISLADRIDSFNAGISIDTVKTTEKLRDLSNVIGRLQSNITSGIAGSSSLNSIFSGNFVSSIRGVTERDLTGSNINQTLGRIPGGSSQGLRDIANSLRAADQRINSIVAGFDTQTRDPNFNEERFLGFLRGVDTANLSSDLSFEERRNNFNAQIEQAGVALGPVLRDAILQGIDPTKLAEAFDSGDLRGGLEDLLGINTKRAALTETLNSVIDFQNNLVTEQTNLYNLNLQKLSELNDVINQNNRLILEDASARRANLVALGEMTQAEATLADIRSAVRSDSAGINAKQFLVLSASLDQLKLSERVQALAAIRTEINNNLVTFGNLTPELQSLVTSLTGVSESNTQLLSIEQALNLGLLNAKNNAAQFAQEIDNGLQTARKQSADVLKLITDQLNTIRGLGRDAAGSDPSRNRRENLITRQFVEGLSGSGLNARSSNQDVQNVLQNQLQNVTRETLPIILDRLSSAGNSLIGGTDISAARIVQAIETILGNAQLNQLGLNSQNLTGAQTTAQSRVNILEDLRNTLNSLREDQVRTELTISANDLNRFEQIVSGIPDTIKLEVNEFKVDVNIAGSSQLANAIAQQAQAVVYGQVIGELYKAMIDINPEVANKLPSVSNLNGSPFGE